MKKKTKWIVALGLACIGTLALGACAKADRTHENLKKDGFTVIVEYESNGGYFFNIGNLKVIDRLPYDAVAGNGVKLLPPGDSRRGDGATTSTLQRSGYQFIGWYRSEELRVDEEGNALDENGDLVSETNLAQGHVFSGKWDFENDLLKAEDLGEPDENGEYRITLYAAWAPQFTFIFYRPATAEEQAAGAGEWIQYGRESVRQLDLPFWSEASGKVEYGKVPKYDGHTLEITETESGIYQDAACTQPFEGDFEGEGDFVGKITHPGVIHEEDGTAEHMLLSCYTKWTDGTWFRIKTAKQFVDNYRSDGCYDILADLDFREVDSAGKPVEVKDKESGSFIDWSYLDWKGGLTTFTGILQSDVPRKLSYLHTTQSDNVIECSGGVFGEVADAAQIKNISFENIVYDVEAVRYSRSGGTYGLFAGVLSESATLENVSVSGTVRLGAVTSYRYNRPTDGDRYFNTENRVFSIGLISGNGELHGLSMEHCTAEPKETTIGYVNGQAQKGLFVKVLGHDEKGILNLALANPAQ